MPKPLGLVLTLSLGVTSLAATSRVVAATCEAALEELAGAYGLTIAVPRHAPPGADGTAESPAVPDAGRTDPTSSERLAETGGVLEPPRTGDPAVIEPPPVASGMPTAPKLESKEPLALSPAGPEPDAATRTQVEALLYAGMAAAAEGREERCFERLREARGILEPGRVPTAPQRN